MKYRYRPNIVMKVINGRVEQPESDEVREAKRFLFWLGIAILVAFGVGALAVLLRIPQ